jgi:hypothetical protein
MLGERGSEAVVPLTAMAKGGIVHKPTIALLGEHGPEAVIPLPRPSPVLDLSRYVQGKISPLAQLGASAAGQAYPLPSDKASKLYGETTFDFAGPTGTEGRPHIEYAQTNITPGQLRETLIHESGHAGRKMLLGTPAFSDIEKRYPETQEPGFEEVRQRIADVERFEKLGSQAMHSRSIREEMGEARSYIGRRNMGMAQWQRAIEYNKEVNDLASQVNQSRATIDGASRNQQINAGGHIRVQIGRQSTVGTQPESLFKPIPEQQVTQMTPATIGPSERVQSPPPSLAGI